MAQGPGAGRHGPSRGPGGGWRALIADVRGEGNPLLAMLDHELVDPPAALAERYGPSVLEEAWRQTPRLESGPGVLGILGGDAARQVS